MFLAEKNSYGELSASLFIKNGEVISFLKQNGQAELAQRFEKCCLLLQGSMDELRDSTTRDEFVERRRYFILQLDHVLQLLELVDDPDNSHLLIEVNSIIKRLKALS